ncbi:MAG TPA: GntR family transcriptional regulator [Xanthomonadales bacterium]|nr:GntR family transcriptional regulator [Xanthomonadales bacterium]
MAKAAQKAYKLVRDRILSGQYPPSLRITEQEIADASGVSRTPVREALQRLQNEGFVRVAANQGAVVVDWSDDDADDVFELRALLEPYGASRAATRIDPEGIEKLRSLAQAQYQESARRAPGYTKRIGTLNSQFHRTLHEFAASPRLSMLMPMLIDAPLVMRTFTKYDEAELLRSASHHLEIVSALEARDPDWAAAITRSHILAAQRSTCRRKQGPD